MANVKISALPAASTPLAGTELVPIVQSGVTSQSTVDQFNALLSADLAANSGSALIGYISSASAAIATTVQAKFRESISVKDFGAKGDYNYTTDTGTDDSAAIQLALNSGYKTIIFPEGNYLIGSTITISNSNMNLVGLGGRLVRAAGAMASNYVFSQSGQNYTTYDSLMFGVRKGTLQAQTGGFINLTNSDYCKVVNCVFDAERKDVSTNKETTFSCVNTTSSNHLLASGNQFLYAYGNCIGANDGTGTGTKGINVSITGNLFYNVVDTGVGMWTNARYISVVGNIFYRDDYSTPYNGVFIDVAGAQSATITGNSFTGNSMGIRILTNLGYTDKNLTITGNTFQNQYASSTEPATCIKIASYDDSAGGGQSWFNVLISANIFKVVSWGIDVIPTNATTTNYTILSINNNQFDLSAASSVGVYFQKTVGTGNLKIAPGKNVFVGNGSSSAAIGGSFPDEKSVWGGMENLAYTKNDFNITTATTVLVGSFFASRGLYGMAYGLGTCTDGSGVGGLLYPVDSAGNHLSASDPVISSSSSNTSASNYWYTVNADGTYQIKYTGHVAGNNDNFYYLNFVRLI